MKLIPLLRLLLVVSPAGMSLPSWAQSLPSPGLQLPPVPALIASSTPAASRPAELTGKPSRAHVPASRLTLPEKPVTTLRIAADTAAEMSAPESAGNPDVLQEDLLLPGENPLLPGLPAAPHAAPGDFLPSPESPGLMEIQPATSDTDPSADPSGEPSLLDPSPVPASDLSPVPGKHDASDRAATRGPIFRVKGADAFQHARSLGYRFTPAMGSGRRDGLHTVASQLPNVLTSEVHGTRMMQLRPVPLWSTPYIENTFYMFCDASYNAVRLKPGWKIRGIQLKGPNWQWVACPKSGANTASFSVRIRAWKAVDTPAQGSVVNLEGLTLEGPPGATDWKAAFPSLLRSAPMAAKR